MTDTYAALIEHHLQAAGLGAFTGIAAAAEGPVCHLYSAVQAGAYVAIGRDTVVLYDPSGVESGRAAIRAVWTYASVVRQAMDMAGHTWEPAITCDECGQLVDPTGGHDDISGPCTAALATIA